MYVSSYYYICVLKHRRSSLGGVSLFSSLSLSNDFPPTEITTVDENQYYFSPTDLDTAGVGGVGGDMNPESPSLQGV